jgi:hypothetical protein
MEVLQLLSSGHSTREIGRKLYLSEATVRNHIRGLLQAFGAHSQLEVLARAREACFPDGKISADQVLKSYHRRGRERDDYDDLGAVGLFEGVGDELGEDHPCHRPGREATVG